MKAVSLPHGAEVQSGPPQPLFEIEGTNYAPSKDGQRFLVIVLPKEDGSQPLTLVLLTTGALTGAAVPLS